MISSSPAQDLIPTGLEVVLCWLRVGILKRGQSAWGDTGVKWFPRRDRVVQWVNEDQDPRLQSAVISQCHPGFDGLPSFAFQSEKENNKHLWTHPGFMRKLRGGWVQGCESAHLCSLGNTAPPRYSRPPANPWISESLGIFCTNSECSRLLQSSYP